MRSRRTTAIAFAASLVVVVASLGAWLTSRGQGVGTDLEQVTLATARMSGGSSSSETPTSSGPSIPAGSATGTPFPDVPVIDATTIGVPDEVQPPRKVRIASGDISMPVSATGVTADGQMELPDDPRTIGWYRFGALPGDARGSAVLGGHVDSERYGTGPLARLASVRDGATITVHRRRWAADSL